jgi:excisionase family DNA binding protein
MLIDIPTQQQPGIDPAALYSPAQVGQRFSFHEESIRRAVREGRIAAVHIGRKVRIRGDVVLRILSEGLPSHVEAA